VEIGLPMIAALAPGGCHRVMTGKPKREAGFLSGLRKSGNRFSARNLL